MSAAPAFLESALRSWASLLTTCLPCSLPNDTQVQDARAAERKAVEQDFSKAKEAQYQQIKDQLKARKERKQVMIKRTHKQEIEQERAEQVCAGAGSRSVLLLAVPAVLPAYFGLILHAISSAICLSCRLLTFGALALTLGAILLLCASVQDGG